MLTVAGCDSIIVTTVTMDPIYNVVESVTACENASVTYPDGTKQVIESGDHEQWKRLSKKDREWITYLVNTETECNDRSLNVDGTNYKPKYTKRRKSKKG